MTPSRSEPVSFLPDPEADPSALVYAFGGAEPVLQLRPSDVVRT